MKIDLTGQVVAITGAGRGIGREHALAVAGRGGRVVVNDLGASIDGSGADRGPAEQVVSEIEALGGEAVADQSDISRPEGTLALVERAVSSFGRIDAVVANAGITGQQTSFADSSWDLFERMVAVHLRGSWGLAKAAWPHFVAQNNGRIVFTTSGAIAGNPGNSPYATVKAGILGLTRTLALEGADHGIIVNAIAPIAITRMARAEIDDATADSMAITVPPVSVAPALVALLSREWTSSGEIYVVGGGYVDHLYLAQTPGLAEPAHWEPEAMIENARLLTSTADAFVPRDFLDTARHAMFANQGPPDGDVRISN
jgi:NAD(P)-dependent dehydrogenase (short-subunit alcohol dehydrogenase family)